MPISTLRDQVRPALVEFAWGQWAQMGVSATTDRRDSWAQDPEALLVFTLRVGRRDPRLFDEVLDWLRLNGRLVSGRRLASLCPRGDSERPLVEAAVDWARAHGSSVQVADHHLDQTREEPLFASVRVAKADESFRTRGYLKPATEPSFKSREPDPRTPVNLAFRLRHHFGLSSSRAEVMRFLLTSGNPDSGALAIAGAAAYAKRNINETLAALVAAGDVERYMLGNEGRYMLDRGRWAHFLGVGVDDLPIHRDWPRLLFALREIDRWLDDPHTRDLSDYIRASQARALTRRLEPTLTAAGVPVSQTGTGTDYWPTFEQNVGRLLEKLSPLAPPG